MKKQLRHCNATIEEVDIVCVKVIDDNLPWGMAYSDIKDAIILTSYDSVVAVYQPQNEILYLLPRWEYSVTTISHVAKFCDEVGFEWFDAKTARSGTRYDIVMVDTYGLGAYGETLMYRY